MTRFKSGSRAIFALGNIREEWGMTVSIIVLGLLGAACAGVAIAIQLGAFDGLPYEISNVGDE